MSKALEFQKRNAKVAVAQEKSNADSINMMRQAISGVFQKLFQLESQLENIKGSAKAADWRSLAIMKLLSRAGISEDDVTAKAEELQVMAFEKESKLDDEAKGLESFDGVAENGLFAIAQVKVFKDGQELHDSQVVRTKFELGKAELLPQIDEATIGMRPGETKRFPLSLSGSTDEAELTLFSLRKRKEQPAVEATVQNEASETPSSTET